MLLVCLHIYLFRLCIKKDAERGVTFKIFYLSSHTQYVWGYVLVITCQVSVIANMKLWTKILRLVY